MEKEPPLLFFERLKGFARQTPPFTPGAFTFPFGTIRYVDVKALTWQYPEIFLERAYEVMGLSDSPRIIDCGGHIGLSVIWFKQRYPHSQITVFEAHPAIADILEENVHKLALPSVEIMKTAVSNSSGSVIFLPNGSDGGRVNTAGTLYVPSVRLSDYLCEPVDILKLDIEGSEFQVVEDLCLTDKIHLVKHIICEVHGRSDVLQRVGTFWLQLANAGFRLAIKRAQAVNIPGPAEPTPFPAVKTAKFLLHLYAWRP